MSDDREEDLFPEAECLAVFAELGAWTSVDDCLAAARAIEDRSRPEDAPCDELIVPYLDDDVFEAVLIRCFEYLIKSYRVPEIKVRLAVLQDLEIAPDTRILLLNSRFSPSIKSGPAGAITAMFPGLAEHSDKRFLVVQDSPHVIELVQNPIRCMAGFVDGVWPEVSQLRLLRDKARETGGPPTIFHQPYTDGPLPALIEALAFYANGLTIGPNAVRAEAAINYGYRSVEVVGRPPFDMRMFDVAQKMLVEVFRGLT